MILADLVKKELTKRCKQNKLDPTDNNFTMYKKLQSLERRNHTDRGPVPNVELDVLRNLCDKYGMSVYGDKQKLQKRLRLQLKSEKKRISFSHFTHFNACKALRMGAKENRVYSFKNNVKKQLTKAQSGNYYWKCV